MIQKSEKPDGLGPEASDFERESIAHLDTLYCYAVVFASDARQAEDWLREAMLSAYRNWPKRVPDASVRVWLLRFLRDIVTAHQRRNGSGRPEDLPELADPPFIELHAAYAGGDFFRALKGDEILAVLKQLPHEHSEVVVLCDIEGLSYGEVAQVTGAPVGTVKSNIFRGRRLLQQQLYRVARERGHPTRAACSSEP